jgi:hypothetical protein
VVFKIEDFWDDTVVFKIEVFWDGMVVSSGMLR